MPRNHSRFVSDRSRGIRCVTVTRFILYSDEKQVQPPLSIFEGVELARLDRVFTAKVMQLVPFEVYHSTLLENNTLILYDSHRYYLGLVLMICVWPL